MEPKCGWADEGECSGELDYVTVCINSDGDDVMDYLCAKHLVEMKDLAANGQ